MACSAIAALYSQVSSPQADDGLKLIDCLSAFKDSHVLDLGCGTGYLSSVLAELVGPGGKVTGVDPDGERIRLAREQYGSISNLEFVEGHSKDFPSGPYDVVFANLVMHWIEDKEAVFQNVFRHLKVNGQFAFTAGDHVAPTFSQLDALLRPDKPKFTDLLHMCPPDMYETIANRCGFQMEYRSVELKKRTLPNLDALITWMYATTSGKLDYNSISDSALDDIKKTFRDEAVTFNVNRMKYILKKV